MPLLLNTVLLQQVDLSGIPATLPVALLLFFAAAIPFAGRFWAAVTKTAEAVPIYFEDRQKRRSAELAAYQQKVDEIQVLYERNNTLADQITKNNELLFAIGETNVKLSDTNVRLSLSNTEMAKTVVDAQNAGLEQRKLFNQDRETWKKEFQEMVQRATSAEATSASRQTLVEQLQKENDLLRSQVRDLQNQNETLQKQLLSLTGGTLPPLPPNVQVTVNTQGD